MSSTSEKAREWTMTRSIAVPPDFAARLDALAGTRAKRSRSAFIRDMVVEGLIQTYGPRWEEIADALISMPLKEEAS